MRIELSTSRGYSIATALRGPDSAAPDSYHMKYITTAVLRHLVGVPSEHGAWVISPEDAQHYWDTCSAMVRNNIRNLYHNEKHFRAHFGMALKHLMQSGPKKTRNAATAYYRWLLSIKLQRPHA